jgi:putative spermidine/putrescine transport system ATP-binding protein
MSASVEVRHLSRSFGAVHALHDVRLMVAPGEFVTLLGPSGSGKSTILNLLSGFDQPTSGDILIDGRSVLHVPSHLRSIGMVFQNYALFPHMSVADNIAFPLRVRNRPDKEVARRVAEVLETTHMSAYERRFPRELSGGQQQRVALARAIVFDPKVLLMDEPLGALDRHLREQLKFEIKRVQMQFRMTVLFVTHDQDEALVMSDRIVVMRDGRIEQEASPRDLYARPKNRFVANFIGESNIIPCVAKGGRIHFGDHAVRAQIPTEVTDGECWVMVRPELIDITAEDQPGAVRGVLRDTVYLGETTRYIVDVGEKSIIVKKQNKTTLPFTAGQSVHLIWDPKDAVVLSD